MMSSYKPDVALADQVTVCGRLLPRYLWFMISGAVCDVVQLMLNLVVSALWPLNFERDTVAWTVSYTLAIGLRQETHRFFVFGAYEGSYCDNIKRIYMAYATTIAFSIALRSTLSKLAPFLPAFVLGIVGPRTISYLGTVLCTGLFSWVARLYRALRPALGRPWTKEKPDPDCLALAGISH